MRVSPVPLMRGFGTAYVNIVRNIPLTVIILFCSLGLADVFGVTMGSEDFKIQASGWPCSAWSLHRGLRLRGAALRHEHGAARPGGGGPRHRLSFTQTLWLVVLPQAFRSVIGPLANVLIALTKNTTVAAAIGVAEAAYLMKTMIENEAQTLLIGAVFAFGFVVLTLPTGLILGWLSKRLAVKR